MKRKLVTLLLLANMIFVLFTYGTQAAQDSGQTINSDNIARLSNPIDKESAQVTKYDVVIWLIKIINYTQDHSYDITSTDDKNRREMLSKALDLDILHGSNYIEIDDGMPATRETAFTLIDRAFDLDPPIDLSLLRPYKDGDKISQWALASVHDVVTIVLNSNDKDLFKDEIRPLDYITQDEMIRVLTHTIKSEYNKKIDPNTLVYLETDNITNVWQWIKEHILKLWHLYVLMGGTAIALIFLLVKGWYRLLRYVFYVKWKIKREVIYIGDVASGKTELSKTLPHPHKLKTGTQYSPTRSIHKTDEIIIKDKKGFILFHGVAIDTPGQSNDALLNILSQKQLPKRKKIIILLLSHTKTETDNIVDLDYMMSQYNQLEKVYLPAIKRYSNKVHKLIVFFNKHDLLSKNTNPETIFKNHCKLIEDYLKGSTVITQKVYGSAKENENIDKLRDLLY